MLPVTQTLTPDETARRVVQVLKSYLNLNHAPEFVLETVYDAAFGPSFVPVRLKTDPLSDIQRQRAQTLLKPLFAPMTTDELKVCYDRLRLGAAGNRLPPHEEKTRQTLFCEALKAYPPCVVRHVTAHPFKWFPSLGELTDVCQAENRYLSVLKNAFFTPNDAAAVKGAPSHESENQ